MRPPRPHWRAYASGRNWTTVEGCLARIDVVADYDGPAHCGFQSARHIVVGRPVGERYRRGVIYVRDPENVYRDRVTAESLQLRASLPPSAQDTGLRLGPVEMWAIPHEPAWLYLRDPGGVERWPRDRRPTRCD